jgi:hypothetical protein
MHLYAHKNTIRGQRAPEGQEVETLQRQLEENEVVKREELLQAQNETE